MEEQRGIIDDFCRKQSGALVSDSLGPGYRIVLVFLSGARAADQRRVVCASCGLCLAWWPCAFTPPPHSGCPTVSGPGEEVPRPAVVGGGPREQAFEGGTDVLIYPTAALTGEDWPSRL